MHAARAAGLFLLALSCLAAAEEKAMPRPDPRAYVPEFAWQTDAKGVKGITDHGHRIARLQERASAKHVHYSDVLLQDVFLRPPGVGAVEAEPQGYLFPRWRFHVYFIHRIETLEVREQGRRFRLYLRTCDQEVRDPDKPLYHRTLKRHGIAEAEGRHPVFHDEMWLTITYEPERGGYLWHVRSKLTIRPGRKLCIPFVGNHLEYQDLFPSGSFPPPYLPGYKRRKYHWQAWEAADGQVYRVPLHHGVTPDKRDIRLREGGVFAYLLEPTGNLAIQLLGDTAARSCLAICHWMWDPHIFLLTPEGRTACEGGETYEVEYQLFELDEAHGKALFERSKLRPESTLDGVAEPPFRFAAPNTFDETPAPDKPSERWPWRSSESRWTLPRERRHCLWDHTVGRSGSSSLALRSTTKRGGYSWRHLECGTHARPVIQLAKRQRLTAWVRTESVEGTVRVGYRVASDPKSRMQYAQPQLSGTHDWTKVELVSKRPRGGGNGEIHLELRGKGRAWFDDVEIRNLPD